MTTRVAYLNTQYPCLSHTFIRREVGAVRAAGVDVVTFSVRRPGVEDLLSSAHRAEELSTIYLRDGAWPLLRDALWAITTRFGGCLRAFVRSQRLAEGGLARRLLHVAYIIEAMRLVRQMCRRDLSHVHVHMANNGAAVAMLACLIEPRISYSLTVHGSAEFFDVGRGNLAAKSEAATFVRCISESGRAQVMTWTDPSVWPRIEVIHCGLDLDRYWPRSSREGGVIRLLSVGRLSPIKGLPLLIRACRSLRRRGVEFHLDLVGDGPTRPVLEDQIRRFGLDEHVTVHGAIGADRMPGYYENADVLVIASFMEGIPVVAMEAMASGVCVVATDVGGVSELIGDRVDGRLVPPGQSAALVDVITELAGDREQLARLGAAGRQRVRDGFDLGEVGRSMAARFLPPGPHGRPIERPRPPYALVTAVRDEAAYARRTLEDIVQQTVPPDRWVIVDDGSTDETPEILAEYAREYPWITVVRRENRQVRAVGPAVVDAFCRGLDELDLSAYPFFGKVDLDLELPPRYFEILIDRMENEPSLGTCSGKPYYRVRDGWVSEGCGDETSVGMTKFYRTECFHRIGGFVKAVMWDGIDCHRCRMEGFSARSWDDSALRFLHLRPMGASQGSWLTGRMRHGAGQYFMGTGLSYMTISAATRLFRRPYVLGGMAMWWGYVRSALNGSRRYGDPQFRSFLQRYQWDCLLRGKRRATRRLEERER